MHDKNSIDYQVNLESLREMEDLVPMTLNERKAVRRWVRTGNDPETNPWKLLDSDGFQMNFVQALRLQIGYSSGPWDYWKGCEYHARFCNKSKCFVTNDEF